MFKHVLLRDECMNTLLLEIMYSEYINYRGCTKKGGRDEFIS